MYKLLIVLLMITFLCSVCYAQTEKRPNKVIRLIPVRHADAALIAILFGGQVIDVSFGSWSSGYSNSYSNDRRVR
jgi:hypothetical protein